MLWLIGMMGTGKSTVARLVQDRIGCGQRDMDDDLERLYGPIVAQWETDGEQVFRKRETNLLTELAAGPSDTIVATGGGVPLRPENVGVMRSSGTIVWLRAAVPTLSQRLEGSSNRPLLARHTVAEITVERDEIYEHAANVIVDTEGRTVEDIAEEVISIWKR